MRILSNSEKTLVISSKINVDDSILINNKMDYLILKAEMNGKDYEIKGNQEENVLEKLLDPKLRDVVLKNIFETLLRDPKITYDQIEALKTNERLNRILNKILEEDQLNSKYLTIKWLQKYKSKTNIPNDELTPEALDNINVFEMDREVYTEQPQENLEIDMTPAVNLKNLESILIKDYKIANFNNILEKLKKLTSLLVLNNEITEIPDSIGNLTSLTELYLSYNRITKIPDSIGNLTNLTELHIFFNNLTKIPDSIGNLTNLTVLDLSHNRITKIPDSIGNLTNLTILDLSHNRITKIPDSILNNLNIHLFLVYNNFNNAEKERILAIRHNQKL